MQKWLSAFRYDKSFCVFGVFECMLNYSTANKKTQFKRPYSFLTMFKKSW